VGPQVHPVSADQPVRLYKSLTHTGQVVAQQLNGALVIDIA
jgi:hypothetical protein